MQHLLQKLEKAFQQGVPFTKDLGWKITTLTTKQTEIRFTKQEKLIGNVLNGSIHGGAIATILDSAGGLLAMATVLEKMHQNTEAEQLAQLARISTINMHINYLNPGLGEHFVASATIIQAGKKIFRTNMRLYNEKDRFLAEGSGTYLIG